MSISVCARHELPGSTVMGLNDAFSTHTKCL